MTVLCYRLDEKSKKELMEKFPPKYPAVRYDHVTIEMGHIHSPVPKPADKVEVVGIADDGNGIEAFIVKVNDTFCRPKDGRNWHITASFNPEKMAPAEFDISDEKKEKPYKAVTSNGFLNQVIDSNGCLKKWDNSKWTVFLFDKPLLIKTYPENQLRSCEIQALRNGKNR